MRDLEEVRSALVRELGSEDRLPLINARVILRTGVNLTKIDASKAKDLKHIANVLSALREMGFALDGQVKGNSG